MLFTVAFPKYICTQYPSSQNRFYFCFRFCFVFLLFLCFAIICLDISYSGVLVFLELEQSRFLSILVYPQSLSTKNYFAPFFLILKVLGLLILVCKPLNHSFRVFIFYSSIFFIIIQLIIYLFKLCYTVALPVH